MRDKLKHLGVGVFLFLVFGIGVGVTGGLVYSGLEDNRQTVDLDPVAAYCHGVTDGMRHAYETNKQVLAAVGAHVDFTDELTARSDEGCMRSFTLPDRNPFPYLRGPLTVPESP